MNSAPWHGAGVAEAGGMEDLQTDVMRFMAILAFCLVAIFALVQSMPMQAPPVVLSVPSGVVPVPAAQPRPVPDKSPVDEKMLVEPSPRQAAPVPSARTEPVAEPARKIAPRPASAPSERAPARQSMPRPSVTPAAVSAPPPSPAAVATPAPPPRVGFTLRFDTDEALLSLVRSGAVGLYALSVDQAWRLSTRGDGLLFAPATKPASLRMMSPSTIPMSVRRALELSVGASAVGADIGVTLPASTRQGLDDILRRHLGGDIVIGDSGQVRLEQTP